VKITITGKDLEKTDNELQENFDILLAQARENPPRRGKAHAEWHDVVLKYLATNPDTQTPRQIFVALVKKGIAQDESNGVEDLKVRLNDFVVSWDTFKSYCYARRRIYKKS
jgi:hypothetical protein